MLNQTVKEIRHKATIVFQNIFNEDYKHIYAQNIKQIDNIDTYIKSNELNSLIEEFNSFRQ